MAAVTTRWEFRVVRRGSQLKMITMLDFRRVDFGLFRGVLQTGPWDKALEG